MKPTLIPSNEDRAARAVQVLYAYSKLTNTPVVNAAEVDQCNYEGLVRDLVTDLLHLTATTAPLQETLQIFSATNYLAVTDFVGAYVVPTEKN